MCRGGKHCYCTVLFPETIFLINLFSASCFLYLVRLICTKTCANVLGKVCPHCPAVSVWWVCSKPINNSVMFCSAKLLACLATAHLPAYVTPSPLAILASFPCAACLLGPLPSLTPFQGTSYAISVTILLFSAANPQMQSTVHPPIPPPPNP